MGTLWERIARSTVGDDYAATYAERFRQMAESGEDPHGEADLVRTLIAPPGRVLDAGCGTGRVAVRLHELGYAVVGTDVDASMLDVARAEAPELDWRLADLATLDLGETFDLVLVAGNVVPLLEPGTLADVAARLAAHVSPDGQVVTGFGLDDAHLPGDCPVTPWSDYDEAMTVAGLTLDARWSGWASEPFDPAAGYVVAVHVRSGA